MYIYIYACIGVAILIPFKQKKRHVLATTGHGRLCTFAHGKEAREAKRRERIHTYYHYAIGPRRTIPIISYHGLGLSFIVVVYMRGEGPYLLPGTTITQSGPERPYLSWFGGPNFIVVVDMGGRGCRVPQVPSS